MRSPRTILSGEKEFPHRIRPHKALESEYPQPYYKFHNVRVAQAFWLETLGSEVINLPHGVVHSSNIIK